ncbi:MAG: oligosaccharide flippase family protein [Methylocella sp.]
MKKAFLSLYCAFVARYLISFASLPFLARVLGPSGLGVLAIATSLATAISIIVEYGFSISALREISSAEADDRSGILIGVTTVKLALFGLVGLVFGVLALFAPSIFQFPASLSLIVLLGGAQGFSLSWYFIGTGRATASAALDVSAQLMWFIPVFFLVHSTSDINTVLLCQLVAQVIVLAVGHAMALGKLKRISIDWRKLLDHLKSGAPMFIFRAGGSVHAAAIALILGAMAGPAQVGFLNAADRFAGTIINAFSPATQALMPYVYNQAAKGGPDTMYLVARYILIVLLAVSIIFTLGTFFSAGILIHMFTGFQFTESVQVLQILSFIFPIIAINYALGLYLMLPLRLDVSFVAAVSLGQCGSLGFTYLLAPTYGAAGIAFIRVVTEAAVGMMFALVLYRKGHLKKLLAQAPINLGDSTLRRYFRLK